MRVFQNQLEPSLDPLPGDSKRSFAPDPRQYIDWHPAVGKVSSTMKTSSGNWGAGLVVQVHEAAKGMFPLVSTWQN